MTNALNQNKGGGEIHPSPSLSLRAAAKLNLHLSILGRRTDGYHLLNMVMIKLSLADQINLIRRDGHGINLTIQGADLPTGRDNLIVKAAEDFYNATEIERGVEMTLQKHIPVAAGLGGGSSDAAATLKGLNELYGSPLTQNELFNLGLALGADVPFFLFSGSTAFVEGIGERISPAPALPTTHFLLVNPGWPLSTAWVYNNYKLELTIKPKKLIPSSLNESSFTINRVLHNDLESVVLPQYPEVEKIKSLLVAEGASGALMSGSGPTVFGVFSRKRDSEQARERMIVLGQGQWIVILAHNI
ncbi:MAG: 4-(cytidine 5'-diphospho)-2-C-methyl-D-erythritol kinase [Deltaproteobacteria bacterium]|nr:4-(cytidine 5'-diphospho)-2-C-methyl-D-erythritol kinase [Deltaproteobacteria bacterium]